MDACHGAVFYDPAVLKSSFASFPDIGSAAGGNMFAAAFGYRQILQQDFRAFGRDAADVDAAGISCAG